MQIIDIEFIWRRRYCTCERGSTFDQMPELDRFEVMRAQFLTDAWGVIFITDSQRKDPVCFRRNPNNDDDPNAIEIIELGDAPNVIGYLPRELVIDLSPMIHDGRLTLLSGIVPGGSGDGSFAQREMPVVTCSLPPFIIPESRVSLPSSIIGR